MSDTTREIIGRTTMALAAIGLAWAATKLLRFSFAADLSAHDDSATRLFFPVALTMYVIAFTFICFCFASRDPRRSDTGRVMTWGDRLANMVSAVWGWME